MKLARHRLLISKRFNIDIIDDTVIDIDNLVSVINDLDKEAAEAANNTNNSNVIDMTR